MEEDKNQNKEELKIFLIDDDKFLLDMYSLKFRNAGLSVELAFGGKEALNKLRDGFMPNIILLDIIMPTIDGMELLQTIREEKLASKSTIVVLTNQSDDNERAKKLGVDGFLVKAMNIPSEVVSKVLEIYKSKKK